MGLSDLWRKIVAPEPTAKGYSPRAGHILKLAKAEAEKAGLLTPTATHLIIALLEFNQGCASAVLRRLKIDPKQLKQTVEIQPNSTPMEELLAISESERRNLHHAYLGSEHLLLGLIRHGENSFARHLMEQGIDMEAARQEVLKELDPNFRPDA